MGIGDFIIRKRPLIVFYYMKGAFNRRFVIKKEARNRRFIIEKKLTNSFPRK